MLPTTAPGERTVTLVWQPEAARISSEMLGLSQILSAVTTVDGKTSPKLARSAKIAKIILVMLVFFIQLLCYSSVIKITVRIGIADGAADKSSDNFGEADDGEADEGVEDDLLGFLDFVGVASGGGIRDTAINDEDDGNNTGDTDDPLGDANDHGTWVDTAILGDTVLGEIGTECDADSIQNYVSRHDNGETDKGLGKGFFAGGDFARIAAREYVTITTIDNIAENEIGGDDGDVGGDVGNDSPDAFFEGGFGADVNITIP